MSTATSRPANGSSGSSPGGHVGDNVTAGARSIKRDAENARDEHSNDTIWGRARQAQTVITVVVVGVIGLIGVLIFAQVQAALPTIQNDSLQNSSDSLVTGFGDAMQLLPIVLIVLLAAVVIGVVSQMRQ